MHERETQDRRIQKTEALLRGALAALVREKPYGDIGVKEILDRANVGRSTFYTHFSDKDELLLSCIHDMLRSARPGGSRRAAAKPHENLIWFSLPIFEHIEKHRQAHPGMRGPAARGELHQHLQSAIVELIEDDLGQAAHGKERQASPDLMARWIASTFVLVLDWWVECESPLPAREADRMFRTLVEPPLAEMLG